jgi:hypothetical protein
MAGQKLTQPRLRGALNDGRPQASAVTTELIVGESPGLWLADLGLLTTVLGDRQVRAPRRHLKVCQPRVPRRSRDY